jgi:CRP/FNR family cyclic AMP-dependent transcriptional regulator
MEGPPEIAFLRQVPLFRHVEEAALRALWPSFRARRLRKGEVLFRTGDPGDELFLLKTGSIVVSRPVTGRVEQVLARLAPGEAFGEMSVFGDERHRSATCQADTDAVLYSLGRERLSRFIAENPLIAAKFFQHLAEAAFKRLRHSTELVAEVTRWGLEATGLDVEH